MPNPELEMAPGAEQAAEIPSGQPENISGGQPGGDSQPTPGSGSDKPLTQEAFNQIYREAKENREALERERNERKSEQEQWLAWVESQKTQVPSPQPRQFQPPANEYADLPPHLQKALAQNPELAGSVELINAVAEARLKKQQERLDQLESKLGGYEQQQTQAQKAEVLEGVFESLTAPIVKELGLNPTPDSADEGMSVAALNRAMQSLPPNVAGMMRSSPNNPLWQSYLAKSFRAELNKEVQKWNAWHETKFNSRLEEMRKNKGAIPASGKAPAQSAEDSLERQVDEAFAKGKQKELRRKIFGGDD